MPVYLGPLAISFSGTTLLEEEKRLLAHPNVGMVVLFKENWNQNLPDNKRKAALIEFVKEIRKIKPEVLIAVDHEGGQIWRFHEGFTHIPSAKRLGQIYEADESEKKQAALHYIFICGQYMAKELIECGIDLSLAPVLDIDGQSTIIGGRERAFHSNPKTVAIIAQAFIQGMKAAGMPATGKHFPGHGFCKPDSHQTLPVDDRSWEKLREDLYPFQTLIQNKCLSAIMPAHIIYPAVDRENTAGFSSKWLSMIRDSFDGKDLCIMSDCLSMKAVGDKSPLERLQAAQKAGCDFLMLTHQHQEALTTLLSVIDTIKDTPASSKQREIFASQCQGFRFYLESPSPILVDRGERPTEKPLPDPEEKKPSAVFKT